MTSKYFHLQDNQAHHLDRSDKLWKLKRFLNYLTSQFQSLYEVKGFDTIEESWVKFMTHLPSVSPPHTNRIRCES